MLSTRTRIGLASASLIALIAIVDFRSQWEFSFSLFYLLPIGLTTWFLGRWPGVLAATASAAALGNSYEAAIRAHFGAGVPPWYAVVQFVFFLVVSLLLSELRRQLEIQQASARSDPLTGLANRRAFQERAHQELVRAARYGRSFSVALIDVDDFKRLNDSRGHVAGDRALRTLAVASCQFLREIDLVARFGGDEFVLVLPETGVAEAKEIVDRLFLGIRAAFDGENLALTVSAGLATFLRAPASIDEMIQAVDALLYVAKAEGKGRMKARAVGAGPKRSVADRVEAAD